MLDRLKDRPEPKLLILNKVDLVKKEALLTLIAQFGERADFERHLHDLGHDRRRRRRPQGGARGARCPKGRGISPRTRSPTPPTG